ncbi:class I SAM-dependent methyltransferase [Paenibacillus sp. OSY-SE]|uniref:class I SAM-dependent methyltransferase n=1 Tax=Paenibacillus sp. OSY-SE TaxID=1196323 RepID=UPI0003034C42|nr:methyltransferase domain-containing protein [Paenibacillus sp. OSY-SE]
MSYKKYSKSLKDITDIKRSFFSENDTFLKNNLKMADIYKQQPRRTHCKNCDSLLEEKVFISKQGIDYFLCQTCTHLNGAYEDTEQFAKCIYVDEITNYSEVYNEEDEKKYLKRIEKIYKPKAEFLLECLHNRKVDYSNLTYSDIGAGSGYFAYALKKEFDLKNVNGYEVSQKQVDIANYFLNENAILHIEIDELLDILRESQSDVVSMIGVLEHLTNPRDIINTISKNENIKYFYLSLPLFSYAVFFELLNQDCFNRHLSGGHTHLYTRESISHFCKEFGLEIIGEWQFGTDSMDLFRFFQLKMHNSGVNPDAVKYFSEKYITVLDDLQSVLDRSHFSSEVHLLLSK